MTSRVIRVLLVVAAAAFIATAGYFLKTTDANTVGERAAAETLREQARALSATLAHVRAGQVAYVARGQGEGFWMSRVSQLLPVLDQQLADFKAALTSPAAQSDMEPAEAALENFHKLDARAQEYVRSGDEMLASDLIFSDGLEATATAATQIEAALKEERTNRERSLAALRQRELLILGAGAGGVMLIMILLGFTGARTVPAKEMGSDPFSLKNETKFAPESWNVEDFANPEKMGSDPIFEVAALCTELARVHESRELPVLLERTAGVLGASGLVVWIGDLSGREMRPAMSFGYSDQVMTRMGRIRRDAANAAAAAWRSAKMRTVNGDEFTNGALVAPIVTPDGCIGVLSAEMKGGSEKDERSQALASIVAAQLATLVSPPSSAALPQAAEA